MALTPVSIGSARFRVGTWPGAADVAQLAVASAAATMAPWVLTTLRDRLRDQGYRAVITAAVAARERDALIDDGFAIRSELATLSRDLETAVPRLANPRGLTRRGRWRDLDVVLQVDAEAFAPFWRLDADGIHEARAATPASRWRVNRGTEIQAYSITGRARSQGYLQRLAVASGSQGRGLGTLLVLDALTWLRRGGARTALVNTQPDNERALDLYQRCGFRMEPDRLAVLHRDLR
jgi:ribosomal protein S18 acetylase RimI-like enzyme